MLDSQIGCAGLGMVRAQCWQCMEESLLSIRVAGTIHCTESSHSSTLLYDGARCCVSPEHRYIYSISNPMTPWHRVGWLELGWKWEHYPTIHPVITWWHIIYQRVYIHISWRKSLLRLLGVFSFTSATRNEKSQLIQIWDGMLYKQKIYIYICCFGSS